MNAPCFTAQGISIQTNKIKHGVALGVTVLITKVGTPELFPES